jgi:DNA polymerase III epsilon subunit-like protein
MAGTSCVIDTETGGLEPHHPTIQIAAVCIDNDTSKVLDEIEVKLEFDLEACDPTAMEINSYDAPLWAAEAILPEHARAKLEAFFRKHADLRLIGKSSGRAYNTVRLIAHNAPFDMGRLRALWGAKFTPFCWWYPLDTLQLALWRFATDLHDRNGPTDFKLETLCSYFGIETASAHDALCDCRYVAALLPHLLKKETK